MSISFPDFMIVFGYLIVIIGFGLALAKQSRRPEDFMVAGRSMKGWVLGFSIFATMVSNVTLIGTTGKVFGGNWSPIAIYISLPIVILIAIKYFMPFHRKNRHISAYTHLENRFGPWARIYAAGVYIIVGVFRMGTVMYLMSIALVPIMGMNEYTLIAMIGSVVIVYTYVGGIKAVIWTDFIQGLTFIAGILITIGYILFNMPEGPGQVFTIAAEHNKFSLGDLSLSFSESTFWVMLILGFISFLQDFSVNQPYVQRYIAAESEEEAKKSLWLSLWLLMPFALLTLFLGTALFAFYHAQPELSTVESIANMKADCIYPHFIAHQIPIGISGLLIAGILAAAMSSIDSALNSVTTVFLTNIYHRHIDRHPGEMKSMHVLHFSSLIAGGAAIALALALTKVSSIWDTWFIVYSILGGGILGLFLLGLMSKKANNRGAMIGLGLSILLTTWMVLTPKMSFLPSYLVSPFDGFMIGILGTLTIILGGVVFSRIFKSKPE